MLEIIVLAAGMGKRMHSKKPKVLQTIAGAPLLQHVLETAAKLTPDQTVVVVGHQAPVVQEYFADYPVNFALQEPPQGTAHAVYCALPLLHGAKTEDRTLILYGDVPFIQQATLQTMIECSVEGGSSLVLLTDVLDSPTGYGRIIRSAQGNLEGIVEEKDASDAQRHIKEVNTGMMVVPTEWLLRFIPMIQNHNAQNEFYLTDLIALVHAAGLTMKTVTSPTPWEVQGVNDRSQLAALEGSYQNAQAQKLLLAGVQIIDPYRIDIRGTLHCEADVTIDVGCVFEGTVTLGSGVVIEPYCILKNCQIADNTRIKAFSHLDGAIIGQDAHIGPYARIRPHSLIANDAHVGNFVEVKNSQIGNGSKANHLSYIGDAYIGHKVNVGAGVITANYDGAHKHNTVIHDNVFVGSDAHLIAPVEIGAGATIAAGTTLTKNVPAQALVKTKVETVFTPNWQRPQKESP